MIDRIAREEGLAPELAHALYYNEHDPQKGLATTWGDGGKAYGPFQLHDAAAKDVGVNRFDLDGNIRGGIRYYKRQLDATGNPLAAAVAYNRGPGMMKQIIDGKAPADQVAAGDGYAKRFFGYANELFGVKSASANDEVPAPSAKEPEIDRAYRALRAADAAGATEDARSIAQMIRRMEGEAPAQPQASKVPVVDTKAQAPSQNAPAATKPAQEAPTLLDAVKGAIPFSDEVSAAGAATGDWLAQRLGLHNAPSGTWSENYGQALERERQKQGATTTGQDITAGLLTAPLWGGTAAVKALPKGVQAAKSVLAGGGIGGLYGFAGGEGVENRVDSTLLGGAVGAGVGAAAPLVGGLMGGLVKKPVAPAADIKAAQRMQQTLSRAGALPEDAVNRMYANPSLTVAEAIGEPGERMARAVASTPGQTGKVAADLLGARSSASGARVMDAARQALGADDAYQVFDDLVRKRAADSAPAYAKAMAVKPAVDDHLARLIDDPISRKGLQRGIEIQRLEAAARNEEFNPLNFNLKVDPATGVYTILPDGPNMRALDMIKAGLDDIVEEFRDPVTRKLNLDRYGKAVNEFRSAFLNKMDDANPLYKQARQAWAGPSTSMDDLTAGLDFMKMNRRDASRAFGAAKDKDMYRLGVVRAIEEKVGGIARGNSVVGRMADIPNFEEKIRMVFPKEKAEGMIKLLKSEKEMKGFANYVLGGSRTAPLQQDIADIMGQGVDVSGAMDAIHALGGSPGAIARLGERAADRWVAGGNERVRNALGKSLFSSDPKTLLEMQSLLERNAQARKLGASNLAGSLGRMAPAATGSVMARR